MPVNVQKILQDRYYDQLRKAETQAEIQEEPLAIRHAARFYADPLFWELLLILFLVSLKAWKAGRSILFCLLIAGIVLLSPFIGVLLYALFARFGFPFDLEVVRLATVLLIAFLFYVYISLSR
jgi:hypothetical protein